MWFDNTLDGQNLVLRINEKDEKQVDAINLRLGYRFQITSFRCPVSIEKGETVAVAIKIRNAGVAPCYKGGYVAVSFLDKTGKTISSMVDTTTNVKNLMPAENAGKAREQTVSVSLNLPGDITPGNYSIALSIGDEKGNPVYRLPYDNEIQKRYIMSEIKIEEPDK